MTPQQHFWNLIYGWSLGLGFLLLVILIVFVWNLVYVDKFSNPFGPFIRAFERWQVHHYEMQNLKIRAQIAKSGIDPEYIKVMERDILRNRGELAVPDETEKEKKERERVEKILKAERKSLDKIREKIRKKRKGEKHASV